MYSLFSRPVPFKSELFDEITFYKQFQNDLTRAQSRIIIESPYITTNRMSILRNDFYKLLNRGVSIQTITRDPSEYNEIMRYQATEEILTCKEMGVDIVLASGYHHRKLAIIDDRILWEGSLNILSQNHSREFMRRIDNRSEVTKLKKFLRY